MKVEDEFHVGFTDEEAIKISTVGDFRDAIQQKAQSAYTPDYIYNRLRTILIEELVVAAEEIRPEARIVRDLGID